MILEQTKDRVVDLIYSPDDDAYYIVAFDFANEKRRTSAKTWQTKKAAVTAYRTGKVRWEK